MNKKNLIFALILVILIIICGYVFLPDSGPSTTSCLNSVDREMTEFKLAIEDSVLRMSSSPLTFRPEGSCFSSKQLKMQIYNESNKNVCASICGFAANNCYIMHFSSDLPDSIKRKCLNLPAFTMFVVGDNCVDQNLISSGYNTIDPTVQEQLLAGQYVIRNVSLFGDPFPKICIWYKK